MTKAKYCMFNRTNEWIIYDSKFKRLGKRKNKPKNTKCLSPMYIYGKTKGTMGLTKHRRK